MKKTPFLASFLSVLMVFLGGCALATQGPPRPAPINHVVFIKLIDPADADALIADSDELLAAIPSVISYYAGRHVEIGRANVEKGYDAGLYVGFATIDGYEAYLAHPNHVRLVEDWKPRMEWLRVYDIDDDTP